MNQLSLRKRVLWFINTEIERILTNLKSGAVNKEYALGSLNTLFQIASSTKDSDSMSSLCKIIDRVRASDHRTGLFYLTEVRQESISLNNA